MLNNLTQTEFKEGANDTFNRNELLRGSEEPHRCIMQGDEPIKATAPLELIEK